MMCKIFNKIAKVLDYADYPVKEVSLGEFIGIFFVLFACSVFIIIDYFLKAIKFVFGKRFVCERGDG